MGFRSSEIEAKLKNKFGFSVDDSRDHVFFSLRLKGHKPVRTMISHGRKELGKVLEGKMARQLGVSHGYFVEMISCTKSCDDYYASLPKQP